MNSRGRRLGIGALLIAAALLIVPAGTATAAPAGTLDPSFGGGAGFVTTQLLTPTDFDFGTTMAVQSDGKIVVAGQLDDNLSGESGFGVARYNPDGSLDTGFGAGAGFVSIPGSEAYDVNDVAIQSDGKIVVVGSNVVGGDEEMVIVRYNSDGTLDTGFDGPSGTGDGVVAINVESGRSEQANAVDITSSDVIVGGFADTNDSTVAGFNDEFVLLGLNKSNGTLDTSFDGDSGTGNGIVLTDVVPGGFDSEINDLKVDGSGNIVAGGLANTDLSDPGNSFDNDFALAKYGSDGKLATSFGGGDGLVTTDLGGTDDVARAVALDGTKIVAAGNSETVSNDEDFAVARYNSSDGSLDTGFDGPGGTGNGKFTITVSSGFDAARSVAVDGSGRIVLGGPATPGTDSEFGVVRLNGADGSLDSSFSGGMVTADLAPGVDFPRSLALQSDGRILLAGNSDNSSGGIDFSVARFLDTAKNSSPSTTPPSPRATRGPPTRRSTSASTRSRPTRSPSTTQPPTGQRLPRATMRPRAERPASRQGRPQWP